MNNKKPKSLLPLLPGCVSAWLREKESTTTMQHKATTHTVYQPFEPCSNEKQLRVPWFPKLRVFQTAKIDYIILKSTCFVNESRCFHKSTFIHILGTVVFQKCGQENLLKKTLSGNPEGMSRNVNKTYVRTQEQNSHHLSPIPKICYPISLAQKEPCMIMKDIYKPSCKLHKTMVI